ncbi:hypothetical protein DNTS_005794 [Danionella cerebrum]|uniref:SWIM-type domain-containing protein n=1 Tax=Danionella cerebrum TaxID=2873325 RepID=A0A553PIY5_9TELE|nr:hypothetical protein DNTS_005794 [Danionella translucida]
MRGEQRADHTSEGSGGQKSGAKCTCNAITNDNLLCSGILCQHFVELYFSSNCALFVSHADLRCISCCVYVARLARDGVPPPASASQASLILAPRSLLLQQSCYEGMPIFRTVKMSNLESHRTFHPVVLSYLEQAQSVSSAVLTMSELEDYSPRQGHAQPDPARIQQNLLEEQVELWWFSEPEKSLLCYTTSVGLILGCGLGGVGLLSTTTSLSSEWRLGAGTALCLLALAVLLKQLLSSAVQDMNCVRSRRRINILKSGGLSDVLIMLVTGVSLLICGAVLLDMALAYHMPKPGKALNDMYISGVVMLAGGSFTVLAVGIYAAVVFLFQRTGPEQRRWERTVRIFSVSGHMQARRETASSLARLI